MPQYKFVTVEGGDGQPSKLTRSIRSHAIRAGLQKSIYLPKAKAAVQSLRPTKCSEELVLRFEPHGRMSTPRERAIPHTVSVERTAKENGAGNAQSVPKLSVESSTQPPTYRIHSVYTASVDPFNSLPVPMNPEVNYLVRYFLIKFGPNLATLDRKRSWFPYALQSAPTMHSTLAMSAALWRAENPTLEHSIQLEGICQKGEAMREVGTRLTHAGSVSNDSDITFLMFTMSTLGIAEVYDGNFEAAETHLKGVHTLFNSRAGHDSFKGDFVLCKAINLADIQVASAFGHRPIFPLLHAVRVDLPASFLDHVQDSPLDDSITNDSSNDLVGIFVQIRQLLLARQSSMVSSEVLRMMFNVVDDSILRHLYQDQHDISDPNRRSRALVLAAHVLMHVTRRQILPNSPLLRRMCTRLQIQVGLTPSAREIWAENKAALLWIAFVGLLGMGERTETCPEGQWFLDLFQTTAQGWPHDFISGISSIHETLSAFLWDEPCCLPLLVGLDVTPRGSRLGI